MEQYILRLQKSEKMEKEAKVKKEVKCMELVTKCSQLFLFGKGEGESGAEKWYDSKKRCKEVVLCEEQGLGSHCE